MGPKQHRITRAPLWRRNWRKDMPTALSVAADTADADHNLDGFFGMHPQALGVDGVSGGAKQWRIHRIHLAFAEPERKFTVLPS